MKTANTNYRYIIITSLLLFISLLTPRSSQANSNIKDNVSNNIPVIDDKADLFTDYEEVSIIDEAKKQRDQTGFQYIFVTTNDIEHSSLTNVLQNYYNNYKDDISSKGTVLFLIYNNQGSFECELQAYTKARDYLPHDLCDNIEFKLSNYDAKDMINYLFIHLTEVSNNTYTYETETADNTSYPFALIVLILLSCIIFTVVVVLFFIPKKNVSKSFVLPEPEVYITLKKDTYIRTHESIYKL